MKFLYVVNANFGESQEDKMKKELIEFLRKIIDPKNECLTNKIFNAELKRIAEYLIKKGYRRTVLKDNTNGHK